MFVILTTCSIRETALWNSAEKGHVQVVQLLLSCNASVDAKSSRYVTRGHPTSSLLMKMHGSLSVALPLTFVFDFLFLRDHILNVTPLHMAALNGHVDVCRALISAKADPAARDGCDAMSLAVRAHAVRHSRSPLQ